MKNRNGPADPARGDLAIVMTGGGARAAYQVGVLRAIARRFPDLRIQIVTGVSAGAINAVYLCCRDVSFGKAVGELVAHWEGLTTDRVLRSDSSSLLGSVAKWAWRLLSGSTPMRPRAVRGMVDTSPLDAFLREILCTGDGEIAGLRTKLASGQLKAIAVTTLNYSTGQTVTWVMGRGIELWERPNRRSVHARLTVRHIMASASLPLVFPAVRLDDAWHGDGGVRLAAPLSPALHLGAHRIIAMSTRYRPTFEEADQPKSAGYPPPVQVLGHLMGAIFLDVIDQDALRLERLNTLLRKLPVEERGGMREIDLLVLRPSVDLGRLAGEYEPVIPPPLRFLLRGLGTKETSSPDFLSLLLFQPEYLKRLIEIGEADGEARMDEIAALVSDEPAERRELVS
ncbi:MAG TPA: patatin-like phospholipase family protein [Thermoanaerobaculia bacterium]|nr:patatin-like phospholipase family protein [Thermoanaerobaculia bacterium]